MRFNKTSLMFISIWVCIVGLLSCNRQEVETLKKIKTIEIGMFRSEVLEILGKPNFEYGYQRCEEEYMIMEYKHPMINASANPSVLLCKETQIVVGVNLSETVHKRPEEDCSCGEITEKGLKYRQAYLNSLK